jgi:cytochrome oxidase Cu insertion factor (SCO1/SenC/PrrC family)
VNRQTQAVAALAFILVVTAVWWALALWPLAPASPAWVAQLRYVCFGAVDNGLPDGGGWLLLGLQPLTMIAAAFVVWGRSASLGLRRLTHSWAGRFGLMVTTLAVAVGLSAATARVAAAARAASSTVFEVANAPTPDTYPRIDRPAPPLGLVNQHGDTVTAASLRGTPAFVTFAFGHCVTICPIVVRDVLEARDRLAPERAIQVLVVSLDPWRDLPSRLPFIARQWHLGPTDHALSGDVEAVHALLAAWESPWSRDPTTGDITHPRLVYLLDASGRIAYAASGGVDQLVELMRRTEG